MLDNTVRYIGEKESIRSSIQIQQQKEFEYQLIGKIMVQRGHTLFEINTKNLSVNLPEFKYSTVHFVKWVQGDRSHFKQLIKKENCVYIPALNKDNALKRYMRNPNQWYYYKPTPLLAL